VVLHFFGDGSGCTYVVMECWSWLVVEVSDGGEVLEKAFRQR